MYARRQRRVQSANTNAQIQIFWYVLDSQVFFSEHRKVMFVPDWQWQMEDTFFGSLPCSPERFARFRCAQTLSKCKTHALNKQ